MQSTFVVSKSLCGRIIFFLLFVIAMENVACGADESDDSSDVDIINISLHNLSIEGKFSVQFL